MLTAQVLLFDKYIEERETQAAESWRTRRARKRSNGRSKNSGDLCVSSHHHGAQAQGNLSRGVLCEGARYAEIPWINLQAKPESSFQLESLILAQNERWRQA